jgi:hypothetical protein
MMSAEWLRRKHRRELAREALIVIGSVVGITAVGYVAAGIALIVSRGP